MDKRQICIIHGGTTYKNDLDFQQSLRDYTPNYERLLYQPGWKEWLAERAPDFDVLLPSMPNKQNARYQDWALYFSKIVPLLNSDAVLIGHSLGGIFLARYFTDNPPSNPFATIVLVAAPYDDETNESLADFKITDARLLEKAARNLHLLHSRDDPVVPVSELAKYQRDLPSAIVHKAENMQHFTVPVFPELLAIIESQL